MHIIWSACASAAFCFLVLTIFAATFSLFWSCSTLISSVGGTCPTFLHASPMHVTHSLTPFLSPPSFRLVPIHKCSFKVRRKQTSPLTSRLTRQLAWTVCIWSGRFRIYWGRRASSARVSRRLSLSAPIIAAILQKAKKETTPHRMQSPKCREAHCAPPSLWIKGSLQDIAVSYEPSHSSPELQRDS